MRLRRTDTGPFSDERPSDDRLDVHYGRRECLDGIVACDVGAAVDERVGGRMFQVRIHGRGGQGVVTAAELLSVAAFNEGRHAQAFPSFGSERTGAPVVSYCRIDDREIRTREPVMSPDAVIVQDVTLIHQVDLFGGLEPDGYVLINTSRTIADLGLGDLDERFRPERLATCPATELAIEHVGRAVPNAALLGGFAALTGQVPLPAIGVALRDRFGVVVGDRNFAAATAAFHHVTREREATTRAASA